MPGDASGSSETVNLVLIIDHCNNDNKHKELMIKKNHLSLRPLSFYL